ncbi:hypothetical protein ACF0H5_005955 [Mactra antiquata]
MSNIDVQSSVYRADGTVVDIKQIDQAYTSWVHTGRHIVISPCDNIYAQSKINDKNVYPISKHIRGKAILISNTGYQALRLLKNLFTQMGYKIVVHAEITDSMNMVSAIQKEAEREENELVDSFAVIIYGTPERLQLSHIAEALHSSRAPYLRNKPKLVYVIGEESIVQQLSEIDKTTIEPDILLAATGFYGMMFFIYVFCFFVHELSAKDIWKLVLQYSDYHKFNSSTLTTLSREFFFFPGVSKAVLPLALENLEVEDRRLYSTLLENGSVRTYNVRLMFVGLFGAGKTSTARRIMGKEIDDVTSTDGIDVYIGKCKVELTTGEWETLDDSKKVKPYKQLSGAIRNPSRSHHNEDMEMSDESFPRHTPKRRKHAGRSESMSTTTSGEMSWEKVPSDFSIEESHPMETVDPVDNASVKEEPNWVNMPETWRTAQRVIEDLKTTRSEKDKSSECAQVSLWDFAGQYVYYATHQLFFSPRCIYLLVLNLEKDLNEIVKDWYMDLTGIDSIEAQGGVHFWLSSIYTYAKCNRGFGVPPIILVGTHKDKISGDETEKNRKARKYFNNIRDIFYDTPIANHITEDDIILDNSLEDPSIDALKETIMDVAKKSFYWGEEVPARWIELQQALDDRRNDGSNFITLKDLKKINQMLAYPLESEDHLKLFLRVQHEMGLLIHFEDSDLLRNTIILEPQWIIHAFRHLIRAKDFSEKYGQLKKQWEDFNDSGRLSIELAESIWKQDHKNHFYENFDLLLGYLEKLDIIVRATELKEDGRTKSSLNYYYVPCLLKEVPITQLLKHTEIPNSSTTPILWFSFTEKFLPPAIFNRVIALCLAKWPVARQGKTRFLFCGCAVFEVKERPNEDRHRLHIYFKKSKVGLRVTRYSSKEVNYVDIQVCDRVRRFVASAIRNEFSRFENNVVDDKDPFSYKFQCERELCLADDESLMDLKDVVDAIGTDASCTLQATGPHKYEPINLLREWFSDRIPEQYRIEKSSMLDQWIMQLPESLKSQSVSNMLLSSLTAAIGKNWQFLMRDQLGLSQTDIERHQEENPRDVKLQIMGSFQTWRDGNQENATNQALISALRKSTGVNINWDTVKNAFEKMLIRV